MKDEPEALAVDVASEVFTKLLPRIEDLAELKLLLHTLYLANRRGSPGVPLHELLVGGTERIVVGGQSPIPAPERLRRSLDRAVANGVLLRVAVVTSDRVTTYVLPATHGNQALVARMREGNPDALQVLHVPESADIRIYRPNAFSLYEQYIGPLTPLIAEQLRDVETAYPRSWIEEAILSAVQYNKRTWRYIQTILKRWEETGGPDGVSGRRSEASVHGETYRHRAGS